jgi:hypothetical protein
MRAGFIRVDSEMANFSGFVGPAYQAPSIYQDAQELINWYPEVDPTKSQGDRGFVALYPTPGTILKFQFPAMAEVRGFHVLPGSTSMLAVCGSTVYLVSAALVLSVVGSLSTNAGQVSMVDNRVAAMIVDGVNRYSYTIASGVLAVLPSTDGAFQGATKVDYVDDFFVYSCPNSNQWGASSALLTTSPALSFSSKDSTSDNIVGFIADHRQVYLIGEITTEVWVNVGSFPFPFQRVPGTSMQHGCVAKDSVARLGESVAWLSKDDRGQTIVIQLVGYSPKRLSTHAVETDIAGGRLDDAIGFTYQQGGHEFYVLTFPTQDKTWVYDLAIDQWHKRAWRNSTQNTLHRIKANCHADFQGLCLVGDYANGNVYAFDLNTYTDNGTPIKRIRRTPHLTTELNRVFYEQLQIQFQPGVGLVTGQGSDPTIMLRWSNDGASTWSNIYTLPIGKIGEYKNRAIKRKMGWARDRVFEVSITDPVKAVIISAEIQTSVGKS